MRRSALIAGVLGAGLVFAASGSLRLKVGFDQLGNLPEGAHFVRGYEELTEEYPGGILAPVNVLVEGEGLNERGEELLRLQGELQGELLDAGGSAITFGPQYEGRVPGVDFVTPDGSAARIVLVFYDSSFSPEALDQARYLQEDLPMLLGQAGLGDATGAVGGQTALAAAARDTSETDLKNVAPLVFATVYQDTVLVVGVVRVAPDMGTLVYHHDPPARSRETLRDDAAAVARANHQNVDLHTTLDHRLRHRYSPYFGNATWRSPSQTSSPASRSVRSRASCIKFIRPR
jgi:hypothetical protein